MISVLSFNRNMAEQELIENTCRREVALRSNEEIRFIQITRCEELNKFEWGEKLIDIIYYEIIDESDIERLKALRKREPAAALGLLTAVHISPILYLKPQIAPKMLALKPLLPENFIEPNRELFETIFMEPLSNISEECFVLKARDNRMLVPYEKISYFEASNKKINLRIGNEEYDFYDSIENIASQVPDYFVRCHRAYLINTKKIKKVRMAENIIELYSEVLVPLSRSYRKIISELIR